VHTLASAETTIDRYVAPALATDGYTRLAWRDFDADLPQGLFEDELAKFRASYADLRKDPYMRDGGDYRYRRFARFEIDSFAMRIKGLPHEPFFQSSSVNTLNGGIARHFEPFREDVVPNGALHRMIRVMFSELPNRYCYRRWKVYAHQIRIVASASGAGKPTPEGIHQDGHHYVGMVLMRKQNVRGGLSRIYSSALLPVEEHMLQVPADALLVDDRRVFHDVTTIEAIDPSKPAMRDMLLIDFNPCLPQERQGASR
jgi:hypothetical protein